MHDTPPHPTAAVNRRRDYWNLACLLAVIAVHILAIYPMFNGPASPMDEGAVLVYPELFLKGIIAHRDFESAYPPGNIWLLAGVYKLLGNDVDVERTVGVLYHVLLLTGIFCLFRPRGLGVSIAGCLLSTYVIMRLGPAALAWMGALAWSILALVMLGRGGDPRSRAISAGFFAGLAASWRFDMAPGLILGIGAYCLLAKWRPRDWLWLILGGVVASIPLCIHIVKATPAAFFENVFYIPVVVTHRARQLPLDFSKAYVGQLYSLMMLAIAGTAAVAWFTRRSRDPQWPLLVAAGLFTLGISPQAYQRMDSWHIIFVDAFAVPLIVYAGSFVFRDPLEPLFAAGAVVLMFPQEIPFIGMIHSSHYGTLWIANGDRAISAPYKQEQQVIDFLQANSTPGQSLFVGTQDLRYTFANDLGLYYLFPALRPATYFLEFNPLSANRPGSRLAADLATADWAILNSAWNDYSEPNDSSVPGPDAPNQVIQKQFRLVYSNSPFSVYRRIHN